MLKHSNELDSMRHLEYSVQTYPLPPRVSRYGKGKMPIPNAESAFVPSDKLSDYLLNPDHPVGGTKAEWFFSRGYDPSRTEELRSDLLHIVHSSSDYVEKKTRFGVKYGVRGRLESPVGQPATVYTVWITETHSQRPRLVTAYPA